MLILTKLTKLTCRPPRLDEYVLEDLTLGLNCLVQRVFKTNFAASWEEAGEENQAEETYQLTTVKSLQGAVDQLTSFYGMQPCERSDRVGEDKTSHVLLLAGQFKGGIDCLIKTKMVFDGAVNMKVWARSPVPQLNDLLVSSI
eukprot:sb/3474091/